MGNSARVSFLSQLESNRVELDFVKSYTLKFPCISPGGGRAEPVQLRRREAHLRPTLGRRDDRQVRPQRRLHTRRGLRRRQVRIH